MNEGLELDKCLARLQARSAALEAEEQALVEAGCLKAYIHFKADKPNTMFLLSPVDSTGKRKYTHIGVNPEKQAQARAAVEREEKRALIHQQRWNLREAIQLLQWQIKSLLEDAQAVISEFVKEEN